MKLFWLKLGTYFGFRLISPHQKLNIPSVGISFSLYLFSVMILINYPLDYCSVIQSRILFGVVPTHWNINKLNEGELLFRYSKNILAGKKRYYENLIAERI